MKRLFGLLFLAVASPSFAQVSSQALDMVRTGANTYEVRAAPGLFADLMSRSVNMQGPSGNYGVSDAVAARGPAGALPITAARTVSGLGVARAIAGQVAKGVAPVAMGMAAYELVQAYRMRNGAQGLEIDDGALPGTRDVFKVGTKTGTTKAAACTAYAASVYIGEESWFVDGFPVRAYYRPQGYVGYQGTNEVCIVDGFNHLDQLTQPGFRVELFSTTTEPAPCTEAATGASLPMGADGKCPTGRYDPITSENAAVKLAAGMTVAAVTAYINSSSSVSAPVPEAGPMSVSGPASQVGTAQTTITTTPTGSTTQTVTPTYNYTYGGSNVTVNTTNQTVTNITTGGVTTTTTETKPETPQDGNCDLYPNTIGCMELGTAPDSSITPVQKSVSVEQESIDLPSGCPADIALPGGRVISYATACDSAVKMAPLVIAAGVLSALLIAVAAIRSN